MALYAVIATTNPAAVESAVAAQYGAAHFSFASNTWFVSDSGTSKMVADKLGLTNGKVGGQGIVVLVSGYSGFARADTWTWLQQYPEALPNG